MAGQYEVYMEEQKLALETKWGTEVGGLAARLMEEAHLWNEDTAVGLAKILLELTRKLRGW